MNKAKCEAALAEMAAICPQNVSGCVRDLATIVEGQFGVCRPSRLVRAIQSLRRADVDTQPFVDAFAELDRGPQPVRRSTGAAKS